MNTNNSSNSDGSHLRANDVVARAVSAFDAIDRQTMPDRPSDAETMSWLSENTKLDVNRGEIIKTQSSCRRNIMRFMTPLAALAAIAALIVTLALPSNDVFSQIVKQIKEATSVKFEISIQQPKRPELSGNAAALRPNLLRIDWNLAGQKIVNITNYETGELISFDNTSNVTIHEIPSDGGYDVIKQLQQIDTKGAKRLPDDENEITDTDLFQLSANGLNGQLWVDKQSSLPVRMELVTPKELGGGKTIYSNFEWDAAIDKEVFDMPAGRKVVRNSLLAEPTEEELISAFRLRNAFSDQPYPADFISDGVGLVIGQLAYDLDKSRDENYSIQSKKLANVFEKIGVNAADSRDGKIVQQRIDYLCMKTDDWEYYITKYGGWIGAGVNPGENAPLCWWKLPGEGVRVLYGDLTIRDAVEPPKAN